MVRRGDLEAPVIGMARAAGTDDPYGRLLGDAMRGDAMLFVREDAVEAAWAIVEPILANATALHEYDPGSWGPREADRLAVDVGGWHNPEEHHEESLVPVEASAR
jgi:glucose-6-phosphate 1-dehydrogenase